MKKYFLLFAVAVLCATAVFAQSSLVATLSHEGSIQIFHGQSAYAEALGAADHGDIITLSSGRFKSANITKAVTIRGAGFEEDSENRVFPTIITGNFDISIDDEAPADLTIEGIYHGNTIYVRKYLRNATLMKSSFQKIIMDNYANAVSDLQIIHCQINESISFGSNSSASIINSFVKQPTNSSSNSNLEFTNCIIIGSGYVTSSDGYGLYNSVFYNDIIYSTDGRDHYGMVLQASNNVYYCIGYQGPNKSFDIFRSVTNTSNTTVSEITSIFKNDTFYELTDEAKATYLGEDGTEVGIYGGDLPYSPKMLNPQITKCQVAKKTTADGKLSVDIEVKAAE